MPRNQIGQAEFEASYALARDWLSGKLSRSEAVSRLHLDFGVNRVSAGDLLQAISAILKGEGFTRSISAAAAEFYVKQIAHDDGLEAAKLAVASIEKHVEYYEGVQPSKMHKMRATLASLGASLAQSEQSDRRLEFDAEISRFLMMSPEQRFKALPPEGHKPDVTFVLTKTYKRSAAVVAHVLSRANGICETCRTPAPFNRSSDGAPFLEVHHRIQLAAGGDDTAENAIAVCPNCHRKHHFG